MITGKMLRTIKLLGTDLELKEGEIVKLVPATNIPKKFQWYATPRIRKGNWKNQSKGISILVDQLDFILGLPPGLHQFRAIKRRN